MQTNLSDVEQRVKRYWYTDGLGELIGGGMFLLLGLYFSAQQYFGDRSFLGVVLQSSFVLVFIGGTFIARSLINVLKTRLTYPRTGYVEYSNGGSNIVRRIGAVVLAMTVAIFSIVITRKVNVIDSMVAVTGILVGIILLVKQGRTAGLPRFYVLSFVSMILGIALSFSGLPRGYDLGAFYGLMGTAFVLSGSLTLGRYLRENPLPAEESNG